MCYFSYKKELPELLTIRTKFISKDIENNSNLILQDQLNKSNKLIDILRQENIQQKSEVYFFHINKYIENMLNYTRTALFVKVFIKI